jgi:hypothetical protein
VETEGWQTRGSSSFSPSRVMWHHTASAQGRNVPSLNVCINGRADLPGPLCQVLQARDNTLYVIAAGKANHAGNGAWGGSVSGNTSYYGLEIENVGTTAEPWRLDQLWTAAVASAALLAWDLNKVPFCCMHKEWAPSRKIDMHTVTGETMRELTSNACKDFASPAPTPEPTQPPPDLNAAVKAAASQVLRLGSKGGAVKFLQSFLNQKLGTNLAVDGVFGAGTEKAVRVFQSNVQKFFGLNKKQFPVDGVVGPSTWFWLTR